jgi:hypothetical protein
MFITNNDLHGYAVGNTDNTAIANFFKEQEVSGTEF